MSTKHEKTSSRSSTAHLSADFSLAIARLLDVSKHRDQVIIRLLYETGMTPQELVSLKKTDLQPEQRTIILRAETTKHKVSRPILITASLVKTILSYARTQTRSEYLFATRQSAQLTTRRIEQLFSTASREAKLQQEITPRDCREAYFQLANKKAITEEELRQLTGLKSIHKRRTLNEKELARLYKTLQKAPTRTQDIVRELLETGIKLGDYVQTISSDTHKVSQLTARRIEQIVSQIGRDAKIDRLTPEVLRATARERRGGDAP